MGVGCFVGSNVYFDWSFPELITIGNYCTLTNNVTILTHDSSTARHVGYTRTGSVTIGNRCFVGMGTIILPGVHIGNNVVIGAGSVVTHDIPDNCVAAGNPAKVIETIDYFITKYKRVGDG